MNDIIERLYVHSYEAIEKEMYGTLQKNIVLLKELYQIVLVNDSNEQSKRVSNLMEERVTELFKKCCEKDKPEEAMRLVLNLYEPILEQGYFIFLDDEIRTILKYIETSELISESLLSSIYKLLYALYNVIDEENRSQIDSVSQSYTMLYNVIYINNYLLGYKKESILKNYTRNISFLRVEKNIKARKLILQRVLKRMIDNKDVENFKNITSNLFFLSSAKRESLEVIFNVGIYLYYLVYKEDLVDGEKFKIFLELKIFNDLGYTFLTQYEDLSLYAESAFKELTSWERMVENETKWMIMEDVIKEFLIFIECSIDSELYKKLSKNEISSYIMSIETYSLDKLVERYKLFKYHFGFHGYKGDKEELQNGIQKFKKIYVEYEINDCMRINNKLKSKQDIINNNLTNIKRNSLLIKFIHDSSLDVGRKLTFPMMIPTFAFEDDYNFKSVMRELEKLVIGGINKRTILSLSQSKMQVIKTYENRLDKLDKFINKMNSKRYNLIITNIESESFFLYHEEHNKKENYKRMIKEFDLYIEHNFYKPSFWLVTNSGDIRYNISEIYVSIEEISKKDLHFWLEKYHLSEGYYEIPIINNIKVKLEQEIAIQYLQATKKKAQINFNLNFDLEEVNGSLIYFN